MSVELKAADYLVFVVEADRHQRDVLVGEIKNMGFEVQAFGDGDSALEKMKAGQLPHILFLDLQMTGLSGMGLAKRARELSDEVEIVFMTSSHTMEFTQQALKLGIYDYLPKPYSDAESIRSLAFHVSKRIYLRLYSEFLENELKAKDEELRGISQLSIELADVVDASKIVESACRSLAKAFKSNAVCFLQYIPQDSTLMLTSRFPAELFGGVQTRFPISKDAAASLPKTLEYFRKIEEDSRFRELMSNSERMSATPSADFGVWKAFPFVTRGIPRGVFVVKAQEWVEESGRPLARHYLQALEKYFENALLHKKVFDMTSRDTLTGLYNLRTLKEKLEQEIKISQRIRHPLSVVIFNIDQFKKYNESNGSIAGDAVLRRLAVHLQKNFRMTDHVARYGGGEMCVVMPHTELSSALKKVEEFCQLIGKQKFPTAAGEFSIVLKAGVAEFPSHAGTSEQLIKLALAAVAAAKEDTSNLLMSAEKDPSHIPPFESKHVTVGRQV